MKKVFVVSLMAGVLLIAGCGGDDGPTDSNGPTIVTVTAATGSTPPTREFVDDSIWTRITPKNVPIAQDQFSSVGKRRSKAALVDATGIAVQALVVGDTLYLRLAWDDADWDRWPGRFAVTSFDILGSDTLAHFTRDDQSFNEDQLMVMFNGGGDIGWDIWWWKMTTTGAGYLAQGANLTADVPVVQSGADITIRNEDQVSGQPLYMHSQGPGNQSYQLFTEDAVAWSPYHPWQLGDLIPGYTIDGQKHLENLSTRGNRYDIGALSRHSSGEYVLVLQRVMHTAYPSTDLDLSAVSTVDVRLGITDNADFRFGAGSTRQGFSSTFKLKLP